MAAVKIEKLVKRYGDVLAVAGVDLDVQDKEFVVLLGPSGSGKTSTLRCVAGLEPVSGGRIFIDERDVTNLPPADRDIAFVFQSYALYPHLTVFENLAFPLRAVRASKAEIEERVQQAAETLRITRLMQRKPNQLSGGEQQRVALGRAIVRRPKAFLMDEPLTNLDAQLRSVMRAELKRLQTDLGATTLYVTHDQLEAMSMGDRIIIFDEGEIQQEGTPMEVYNHPANLFVASFIGSPPMNFIEGVFRSNSRTLQIAEGLQLPLPFSDAILSNLQPGTNYIFGARPEDVHLTEKEAEDALPAEVYVAEPLGAENIINLQIGEQIVKARSAPTFLPPLGKQLWAHFDPDRSHLFDPQSTRALR